MNNSESPSVFICHSSKDKIRFVTKFAKRLRKKGIDAWFDKWEMKVGDSLVKKIFDEGINNCDKFIIILSKNSINSKWVMKELDIGVVKDIEKETIIMPIIIDDDIEIPTVLIATVWKKIVNLKSYNEEFGEIVNAILGVSNKPPLGKLPRYSVDVVIVGSLTPIDSKIIMIMVDYLIEKNNWTLSLVGIDLSSIWEEYELTREQVTESLEILNDEYYIDMSRTNAGWYESPFEITTNAIIEYAQNYVLDFKKKLLIVISKIINENIKRSDILAEKAGFHIIIMNSLLEEWKDSGYLKYFLNLSNDGAYSFQEISARGKRYFRKMLS